jgi:hypothetical protein
MIDIYEGDGREHGGTAVCDEVRRQHACGAAGIIF